MATRTARRRASRLFVLYAAASLVPVAVLGAVLGFSYRSDGERHALEQGRAQADVIGQMAISPALEGATPKLILTPKQRTRLWAATNLAVFQGSISQLRLIDFNGHVVFSDDGEDTAVYDPAGPSLSRALDGHPVARLVYDRSGHPQSIRVLESVVTAANGRSVGALEVQVPYAPIEATVQQNARRGFIRLGLGLLGLYLVLGFISWWTTRALARNAADHEHQALHDALTGLPNRKMFERAAATAVDTCPPDRLGGLALLDLNRFKEVNDTLGHHAGDELLQVVAHRLAAAFRTDDVVARLGGDEFAVLLPLVSDEPMVTRLLESGRRGRSTCSAAT